MNGEAADAGTFWLLLSGGIAAALLIALVLLRTLSRGRAEVKVTDAIIAVLPIVVALFATGKITKLVIGPEGVTVERTREAILDAASSGVASDGALARIEPEPLEAAAKGGTGRISEYAARNVQALTFQVGGLYVAEIIEAYLTQLSQNRGFRYVVLIEDDRFYGIIEAGVLLAYVGEESTGPDAPDWPMIERWIEGDPKAFRNLAGFVGADGALPPDINKRDALQRLNELDRDWLPVVDAEGHLAGIVDRSRLTASLILDVADQLTATPQP